MVPNKNNLDEIEDTHQKNNYKHIPMFQREYK